MSKNRLEVSRRRVIWEMIKNDCQKVPYLLVEGLAMVFSPILFVLKWIEVSFSLVRTSDEELTKQIEESEYW